MTRSQRSVFVAAEVARAPHATTAELFRAAQRAGFDQSQSAFYKLVSGVRGRATGARGQPKPAPKPRQRRRVAKPNVARHKPAPAPLPPRFREVSPEVRSRALEAAMARACEATLRPVVERAIVRSRLSEHTLTIDFNGARRSAAMNLLKRAAEGHFLGKRYHEFWGPGWRIRMVRSVGER